MVMAQESRDDGQVWVGEVRSDALDGPCYVPGLAVLVQQVAYGLSGKIFNYESELVETRALEQWVQQDERVSYFNLQTRSGAGAVVLGNVYSKLQPSHALRDINSVLATSAGLHAMSAALSHLSLAYDKYGSVVFHVAAIAESEKNGQFVADYTMALHAVAQRDVAVVCSLGTEVQHMSILASLFSTIVPTLHLFDGVQNTVCRVDVLKSKSVKGVFKRVLDQQMDLGTEDVEASMVALLASFNSEMGTQYAPFEYVGAADAESVVVVLGANTITHVALAMGNLGVVTCRIVQPFLMSQFLAVLPKTTQRIGIVGDASYLFGQIVAASSLPVEIVPASIHSWFQRTKDVPVAVPSKSKKYAIYTLDTSPSVSAGAKVAQLLAEGKTDRDITYSKTYNNVAQSGVIYHEIIQAQPGSKHAPPPAKADVVVLADVDVAKSYNITDNVVPGGTLVIKSSVKPEDVEKKFPPALRRALALSKDNISVFLLNPADIGELTSEVQSIAVQVGLLRFLQPESRPDGFAEGLVKVNSANSSLLPEVVTANIFKVVEMIDAILLPLEIKSDWTDLEESSLPTTVVPNALQPNMTIADVDDDARLTKWHHAAHQLMFKEAHQFSEKVRPDLPINNYIVRVQENRRLTPLSYDRNVFHIEFDLTDTGMTYNIGEALGIHALNNASLVTEFIDYYGADPNSLVSVPNKDDPSFEETRTVFQAIQQNIDMFGKPPKKFYEQLAEFSADEAETKSLKSLGGSQGAVEFKRRMEVEMVTFYDVLREFKSARPTIQQLVRLIPPLKRREYSIASSQVVHPDSVHLLIVEVEWKDPSGRDRYGQATRYMSQLQIGAQVTVSVKPSVMKLPPSPEQPIILAGLGTGLAPFRAFVEYKAWQKQQGIKIGDVYLYMGSRHQREEYLYGEEWEAYRDSGVITLLGCAFSRDQKNKIYIQDRMRQTLPEIERALVDLEGSFYLCGPTWYDFKI